jgi:hypothetical protein
MGYFPWGLNTYTHVCEMEPRPVRSTLRSIPQVKSLTIHVGVVCLDFPIFLAQCSHNVLEKTWFMKGKIPSFWRQKATWDLRVTLHHLRDPHWGVTKPPQPSSYTIVAPDPNNIFHHTPFLTYSSGSWSFNVCPQNCTSSNCPNASPSHPLTRKPS